MSTPFFITTFADTRKDLSAQPIDPTWIKEGNPEARAVTLSESLDGTMTSGLWECTAGKFKYVYEVDEVVHILEGEAHVNDGKKTHVLTPGTVVFFPCGLVADWEVPKYVKKVFILRAAKRSFPRRVASALKRRILGRSGS